jgi:hypothetical protein
VAAAALRLLAGSAEEDKASLILTVAKLFLLATY